MEPINRSLQNFCRLLTLISEALLKAKGGSLYACNLSTREEVGKTRSQRHLLPYSLSLQETVSERANKQITKSHFSI